MTTDKKQIVIFKIGRESWGLEMLDIQEIIRIVEITPVPDVSVLIEGIINLRGKVIPVVSMRKIMGAAAEPISLHSRIMVARVGMVMGFVVDAVETIMDIDDNQIEQAPADLYLRDFVKGIIKLNDQLVIMLDLNKILEKEKKKIEDLSAGREILPDLANTQLMNMEDEETRRILHQRAVDLAKAPAVAEDAGRKINLIVFLLRDEWYAVEEIEVREILKFHKVFLIPQVSSYIEGVVNVRGEIMPVINLAGFLGMEKSPLSGESRILIVDRNRLKVGLLIDRIDKIVELDKDTLQGSSDFVSPDNSMFIKGEFHWQDKVVSLLETENIINPKHRL